MTFKAEFDIYDAQCKTNNSLIQVGQAPPIPRPTPGLPLYPAPPLICHYTVTMAFRGPTLDTVHFATGEETRNLDSPRRY